jgi:hypothetical protein
MRGILSDTYLLPALATERHHRLLAEALHARQLGLLGRGRGGEHVTARLLRTVRVSALRGAVRLGAPRARLGRQPWALPGETGTTTVVRPRRCLWPRLMSLS